MNESAKHSFALAGLALFLTVGFAVFSTGRLTTSYFASVFHTTSDRPEASSSAYTVSGSTAVPAYSSSGTFETVSSGN
ncbi:MAG: hypothetical protein IJ130_11880 [Solobacterium sp.]|nr:hypothetical protein [Solobacterium sp.]